MLIALENYEWQWLKIEVVGMMSEGMMNFIYRLSSVVYTSQHLDTYVMVYFYPEIV